MSNIDSKFLDNTRKDLVGGITAVVIVTGLLQSPIPSSPLDSELDAFLSEKSELIRKFVRALLLAACAEELADEVNGTLSEIIPQKPGYYDKLTVNALLSLYAGEPQLKDFSAAGEPDFHANCLKILLKKLMDVVDAALWCRVDAFERGEVASELVLSEIHSTCVDLVPSTYREKFGLSEVWVSQAKGHWRNSNATQKALSLAPESGSGVMKLLSTL